MGNMDIKHIFIIGAGTMGNGVAQVAATGGCKVTCMDVVPAALERAKAAIQKSTAKLQEKGQLTAEQVQAATGINFQSDYAGIETADLVIEAAENPG
jgi:3-hydroxybutyryl-CoA dehydrogenase